METTQAELVAQLILRILAQLKYFELTDLVTERLCRPRHIAIGLALHLSLVDGGVVVEEVDNLLASPVLVVEAGVDDEPYGAQHVVLQVAVIAVRILVKSDLFPQPFRIERSALSIGGVILILAERRELRQFLSDRNLQVVAGNTFVISSGFKAESGAFLKVTGVDHDMSGT